jgi:hypothetical protein
MMASHCRGARYSFVFPTFVTTIRFWRSGVKRAMSGTPVLDHRLRLMAIVQRQSQMQTSSPIKGCWCQPRDFVVY